MAVARKKTEAGVAALLEHPEPVSIQDIQMMDWYAGFALLSAPPGLDADRRASYAFETAQSMMKEREKHV